MTDNDPAMLQAAIECCIITAGLIVLMLIVEWWRDK